MILDFIIGAIVGVFEYVLDFIPVVVEPTFYTYAKPIFQTIGWFIDVPVFGAILGVLYIFVLFISGYAILYAFVKIYDKIRGSG